MAEREVEMECNSCVFYYYEADTNWSECTHKDYDIEKPDYCPGRYSIEDAKADAKYKDNDKY